MISHLERIEAKLDVLLKQQEAMMGDLQDMEKALNTIQSANAEIAKDLEQIGANQTKLAKALAGAAAVGSAAKSELEQLTKQAEQIASDISETEQKADAVSGGSQPGNALPGGPPPHASGQPVPGRGHVDAGLPPSPGHPGAGLPNAPAKPDAGLPPGAQPKK